MIVEIGPWIRNLCERPGVFLFGVIIGVSRVATRARLTHHKQGGEVPILGGPIGVLPAQHQGAVQRLKRVVPLLGPGLRHARTHRGQGIGRLGVMGFQQQGRA